MHERFEIRNADGLIEGAEVDCVEGGPAEVVHNHYRVTREVENELIQLESTPSVVYDRATNRKKGTSNVYIYFDFAAMEGDRADPKFNVPIDDYDPTGTA